MLRVTLVSPRHTASVSPVPNIEAPVTVPLPTRLHAITDAYAAGDAPLGERLFLAALDEDLAWDMVCAAAARGIAAHRAATHHAATDHAAASHGAEGAHA